MASLEVQGDAAFERFPGNHGAEGGLSGHLLLMVSGAGRAEDHFRVVATGRAPVVHTFSLEELGDFGSLAGFELTIQQAPGELSFKTNTVVTKWENLADLVAASRIQASTEDLDAAEDQFRAAWAAAAASDAPPAAALHCSRTPRSEAGGGGAARHTVAT